MGTRQIRLVGRSWLSWIGAAAVVLAAVPWVAGATAGSALVGALPAGVVPASWTAWAETAGVPEQGYSPDGTYSGASSYGTSAGDGFPVPAPPARPVRPSPPRKPWPSAPIVTYRTPTTPTPTPRPSVVTLASTPETPPTPQTVFPATQVCLPLYGLGTHAPVTVTSPKGGPTTMTWWHNGDRGAVAYYVGVQTLAPRASAPSAVQWVHLTPPTGCHDIVYTVPGLVSGSSYELWLDFAGRTPETGSGVTRVTLNRVGVTVP